MDYKNCQILDQNAKVYQKRQFVTKTDQNYVFLDGEAHILNRLYIIIRHTCFYGFKKIKFWLKIQSVSLRFYQKMPVCDKN
jgi:hypothetical protein